MAKDRPKFDAPPVVETVLSVQFARLPGYVTAHAGWFWRNYLEKLGDAPSREWSQVTEAPRIEDQFEKFGEEDVWVPPSIRFSPTLQPSRTQIIRSDSERMIQVQDSRFILNWRKQSSDYPSYDLLLPEFQTMLQAFESFAVEARFGTLAYNQWEITYVDQLKRGEMWESARDWSKIFPGLSMPPVNINQVPVTGDETMNADWRFSLADRRGRMYISLRQMRMPPSNDEVLNLTLTARGPVNTSVSWEKGFEIGHEALRESFLAMTSAQAQEHWKRRA
jgi:uncharacterized protein (TIGR04255 family)